MLSYEIKGKGIPLVLLHAFPISRKMWSASVDVLKDTAQVILPDLPGFGDSPRQPAPSMLGMAQEVAALLDKLSIQGPVILGGLSMGGYVGFEFLRQFPARVKAFLLFATRATPDSSQARENRFTSITAVEKFGMEPFVKKIIKSQLGNTTLETRPDIIEAATKIMISNKPEGTIDALRAMAERRDSSDLLGSIKVPTLVMAGEEDKIIPAAEMEAMHRQISGSVFHAVPRSGHLINLEQPGFFHTALQNFISAHFR